jgi:thiol peroxidase
MIALIENSLPPQEALQHGEESQRRVPFRLARGGWAAGVRGVFEPAGDFQINQPFPINTRNYIMPEERFGAVTFKEQEMTLVGPELKAGDAAPDYKLLAQDLTDKSLKDSAGKVRLLSVVPSLDTGICALQAKRFNEEVGNLPDSVEVIVVSADLPFAQKRFCGAENTEKIQTLSDHREMAFGEAYGTHIKELRLLSRSIFVIGADDTIKYAQYVKEVASHPDYDEALAALKEAAGI